MAGVLSELNFARPGFNRENTRYAEKGHWYDGNHVRFRDGTPQNIRGYTKRTVGSFDGTARDLITWIDLDDNALIGFGTEKKLYIYKGGVNYDVTPIVSVVTATNALNTTAGSTRIVVSVTGIDIQDEDYVAFTSQTTTVGGNILLDDITEAYEVSIISGGSFAVNIDTTAADTSASAGGDITLHRLLQTGTSISQPGFGWSAGTYSLSTYGTPRTTSNIIIEAAQWSLATWGEDMLSNRRGGRIYHWDATNGFETRSVLVTASPSINNSILVTPDSQFAISLGCTNEAGDYDPLLVRWSSQENFNDWTASATNTAGSNPLSTGSRIVGGMHSRQAVMIWTDTATHTMQYVGGPFVFRFRHVGDNTGLIGPHAAAEFNGIPFWMGDTNFFVWQGGAVQTLDCTVRRYIFDDFNRINSSKVYAAINSEFNEITWLYPSADSLECNRYVSYNPLENYWVYGTGKFTAWQDKGTFNDIITAGSDSYLYNNEPEGVYTADGGLLSSYIESAAFEIDSGNQMMLIRRLIPDVSISPSGQVKFEITTKR
ncbi:MAG: hypothetical protein EBV86_05505, partial [Marivivens sp.]|nr:hypothetical protein [Marivivens sp.]